MHSNLSTTGMLACRCCIYYGAYRITFGRRSRATRPACRPGNPAPRTIIFKPDLAFKFECARVTRTRLAHHQHLPLVIDDHAASRTLLPHPVSLSHAVPDPTRGSPRTSVRPEPRRVGGAARLRQAGAFRRCEKTP